MVKIILFILSLLLLSNTYANVNSSTAWTGSLAIGNHKLPLVIHLEEIKTGASVLLDSPSQGSIGNQGKIINSNGDDIEISFPTLGATYKATFKKEELIGTFQQAGQSFSLTLTLNKSNKTVNINRPQEPKEPLPYFVEELLIASKNATLSATLSFPKSKKIKAGIVLVSGSGPQDKDENIAGHKPFLVLSDHLVKQGYAVIRYDDRGFGASTGDYQNAGYDELRSDAVAAFTSLKNHKALANLPIGYIGHSEGGLIIGSIAGKYQKELPQPDFLIMLAGPGTDGHKLYREQIKAILTKSQMPAAMIKTELKHLDKLIALMLKAPLEQDIHNDLAQLAETAVDKNTPNRVKVIEQLVNAYSQKTMRSIIQFKVAEHFNNINIPVLALFGENDLQVLAPSNAAGIKQVIDSELLTTKTMSNLNHLFQTSETGLPNEYALIEETLSPTMLNYLTQWLDKQ